MCIRDRQSIDDPEGLGYRLGTKALGGTAKLTVLRGGKPTSADIKLIAAPELPAREPVKVKGPSPFTGATLINLSPVSYTHLDVYKRQVLAGDIAVVGDVQILNPNLVICTLDDGAELRVELSLIHI